MNETLNKMPEEFAIVLLIIVIISLIIAIIMLLSSLYELIKRFWNQF